MCSIPLLPFHHILKFTELLQNNSFELLMGYPQVCVQITLLGEGSNMEQWHLCLMLHSYMSFVFPSLHLIQWLSHSLFSGCPQVRDILLVLQHIPVLFQPCMAIPALPFLLPLVVELLNVHFSLFLLTQHQAHCWKPLLSFPEGGTTTKDCASAFACRPWTGFLHSSCLSVLVFSPSHS